MSEYTEAEDRASAVALQCRRFGLDAGFSDDELISVFKALFETQRDFVAIMRAAKKSTVQ